MTENSRTVEVSVPASRCTSLVFSVCLAPNGGMLANQIKYVFESDTSEYFAIQLSVGIQLDISTPFALAQALEGK